jgi:hypothetical protein
MNHTKIFISHTTRDNRDHILAQKLAAGLRERGLQVWIAPDNIPVGSEWEPEIISGILKESTHFLVILSSASVASEWVQREIGLAKQRRRQDACYIILPLFVGKLDLYPESDFIDRFQRVPFRDSLSAQLEEVTKGIDLRPVVPDRYSQLTENFVGRVYVFSAIKRFLERHSNGYFTIIGDPGEGKSAILAEYVRQNGCVAHFNVRAQGINRIEQCLKSIGTQVVARYGLSCGMPPADPTEFGKYWETLFKQVSEKLGQNDQMVIAIDALDEVDMTGHPIGANILFLPRYLPERIYLVMAQRRINLPFVVQAPHEVLDLMDHRDSSLNDIQIYIRQATKREKLRNWILKQSLDIEEFVATLAQKSEYNFMYLRYVMPEIESGAYNDLSIEKLPIGLQGYYNDHWERMGMTADPLPRTKIRILFILAELRRPVSRQLITEFAKEDPITVQHVLNQWREFLHEIVVEGQKRYSVYHSSFLDFLHRKDIVKAAGETIEGIHQAIADDLWRSLKDNG